MNFALSFGGLEWANPARLWLVCVPILVLVLARRSLRAERVMSATLELWQRVAASLPRAAQRRRGTLSLALWLACAGLVLCVLALSGAHTSTIASSATWRIVVDRSPSMYLADGERTRLAVGLELVRSFLDERGIGADAREWIDATGTQRTRSADMPAAWLAAPELARGEVSWTRFDEARVVWLTDRAAIAPRSAVAIESGGPAVPGAVSFAQGKLFVWDGGTKLEANAPTLPVRATIDGTLAAPLADLFAAWCELAGLGLSRVAPDVDSALALHGVDSAPEHEATLALGAANVRVRFAGATQAREEASERMPWLMVDGATIVDWRPGEIRTTITSFEFVSGDRAAIAVAWGELFDRAVRLPSAVVPLTERSAAGDPRRSGGLDAPVDRGHEPASLAALFAAAAAALVLLAWLVRARSA